MNCCPLSVFATKVNRKTKHFLCCGRFISLLVAFMEGKIIQTKSMTKQDFSGEALSKQNIKAWQASLSCDLPWLLTEWSIIFKFAVRSFKSYECHKIFIKFHRSRSVVFLGLCVSLNLNIFPKLSLDFLKAKKVSKYQFFSCFISLNNVWTSKTWMFWT